MRNFSYSGFTLVRTVPPAPHHLLSDFLRIDAIRSGAPDCDQPILVDIISIVLITVGVIIWRILQRKRIEQ